MSCRPPATSGASELSDTISQRAQVTRQIDTLQQSVQDATLKNASIVSSSRVIDPAAAETGGVKRRIVLTLASGLIAGAALGCGIVLFLAITSDRLRRRFDVAAALETTVPVSVGRIAPLPRWWRRFPYLRAVDARRADERQRLAHAIEMALPLPGSWGRLAVACIDNADEVRFAAATAVMDLADRGSSVLLIDLTEQGGLRRGGRGADASHETDDRPIVLRPRGIPALAGSPADLRTVGREDEEERPPSPDLTRRAPGPGGPGPVGGSRPPHGVDEESGRRRDQRSLECRKGQNRGGLDPCRRAGPAVRRPPACRRHRRVVWGSETRQDPIESSNDRSLNVHEHSRPRR